MRLWLAELKEYNRKISNYHINNGLFCKKLAQKQNIRRNEYIVTALCTSAIFKSELTEKKVVSGRNKQKMKKKGKVRK